VIAKIIRKRLIVFLSKSISQEQFGILEERYFREAIGLAQEALHSIKTKKLKGEVLKIGLSKAYGIFSWLYLRMLLTHFGFEIPFTNWIMR
jgi:hypothetical protein